MQCYHHTSVVVLSAQFLLLLALPSRAAGDPAQDIAKADTLLNNGKPKQAAGILRGVISSHPDNAAAHMELGAALASMADNNEYDAAIAEEETALKLDPKSYGARKILGQIYANQNKMQESLKILEEACTYNPNSYGAHRDLGKAQMAAGKTDDAIRSFRKAVVLNPEKIDAHNKLAGLLSKTDQHKEAIEEARKAVKLDLSTPESHLALGNALLAAGDRSAAVEAFEKTMDTNAVKGRRNPLTQASALSGRGWAFSSSSAELQAAVNDQRQAIKIFPSFGPAYIRLAELLSRQDKNKEAESIYKSSMRFSGDDPSVATAYAKFLSKTQRGTEAREMLKKVLEKKPDYKPAVEALSQIGNIREESK